MLASLVLLPLISNRFGSAGWIALGLGQSIGAVVSVIVGMAWPVIGGNAVARADSTVARRGIYRVSMYSRTVVLAVLLALAIPLTLLLAPNYQGATTLFMVGTALNGLTAAWYYSGTGHPRYLVINEGLTRLAGYTVALLGLLDGFSLLWYAGTMAVTGLVMVLLNWWTIMARSRLLAPGAFSIAVRSIREQLSGTLSRLLRAAFTYGGTSTFAAAAPSHLPLYSALDQVQRAGSNTIAFLPSAFVHWVGSAGLPDRRRRIRNSLGFLAAVSALAIPGWLLLGPKIVKFLFSEGVELSTWGHLLLVLAISSQLFCSSVEMLLLIPLGYASTVYVANSVAYVVGIGLRVAGAVSFGALGGVAAGIAVQALLTCYYVAVLLWRKPPPQQSTGAAPDDIQIS